jgi:hypothetical protein
MWARKALAWSGKPSNATSPKEKPRRIGPGVRRDDLGMGNASHSNAEIPVLQVRLRDQLL